MALPAWKIALYCSDEHELSITGFILRSRLFGDVFSCLDTEALYATALEHQEGLDYNALRCVVFVNTGFSPAARHRMQSVLADFRKAFPTTITILMDRTGNMGDENLADAVCLGRDGYAEMLLRNIRVQTFKQHRRPLGHKAEQQREKKESHRAYQRARETRKIEAMMARAEMAAGREVAS